MLHNPAIAAAVTEAEEATRRMRRAYVAYRETRSTQDRELAKLFWDKAVEEAYAAQARAERVAHDEVIAAHARITEAAPGSKEEADARRDYYVAMIDEKEVLGR